ncbi:MAG: ATP-binding protein [Promethearchaeota archaeon]|nr:MAG: ATP-binding protein [Candidatus Lokiarchaeota archaeon]
MGIEPKLGSDIIKMTSVKESFDKTENIGVIGSPSSTSELTVDILGTAVNKGLVGKFSVFNYFQDGADHYALGQITEILMQNVWTQDATMRGIIRQKGRVDPITEKQDIHTAKMIVSSVFAEQDNSIEPSMFGTVPATGTPIRLFDKEIIDALLANFKEELFYLGKTYGTDINLPMWLKNFGSEKYGAGEAYHIGIFGKTGSGKSVLAKMMITGYLRHNSMSIYILDPQGEFSTEFSSNPKLKAIMKNELKRDVNIITLQNITFDYSEILLRKLLNSTNFFERLSIWYNDHKVRFVNEFISILKSRSTLDGPFTPWNYYKREAFNKIWNQIPTEQFLRKTIGTRNPRDRVKSTWNNLNADEMYDIWKGITSLFKYRQNSIRLSELFKTISGKGVFVIIDLSSREKPEDIIWNDQIQLIAIEQILSKINDQAEESFKEGGNLNSLVVIDEAHRLAPREKSDDQDIELIKSIFIDAVRTTRKFGLGWMFISQTLSSLHREILNQIRIFVFGFGLAWGLERQALWEILGGATEALKLYQNFRDPQSSLGKREYPFMATGPISPLSFSGTPLFFTAFLYPDEFLRINFIRSD